MARVARLIAFIGLICPLFSFAGSCPSSYYAVSNLGSTKTWTGPVTSNDILALTYACSQLDARYQAAGNTSTYNGSLVSSCGYWASGVWNPVGGTTASVGLAKWFQGPNGQWVPSDPGTCTAPTCPTGQSLDPDTNACTCDSVPSVGGQMVSGDTYSGCMGGCTIILKSGWYDKTKNVTWGYDWSQNGSKCTVADAPVISSSDPKVQEASKCPAGTCPGTIGTQSVCVACTAPRETTTTKDTVKDVSTPASGASSVSSSSSSGSSSTKCVGETCTTTTTTITVNPDGSKSDKTTTKEQPKQDFCTDNPKSSICTSGTWGGTCGSFSCDGDAVQCAQAKGAWELACSLKVESTDTTVQAGNAAMAKTDESSIKAQLSGANTALDLASRLDSTSLFGTPGACPSDVTLTTGIGALVLPFSSLCPQLNLIGVAMMGLAYLIAAFVVFRPSKGA